MQPRNKGTKLIGLFIGLDDSSYEYIAKLILPYQGQDIPKLGDFLLIDNIDELVVARIMNMMPRGEFTTFTGEKWLSDVALYEDAIGQEIKDQKISYFVKIKLLGRLYDDCTKFQPGISKVPHITSKVYKPDETLTRVICNKALSEQEGGMKIGTFWLDPKIDVLFDLKHLVSRRTFIFARAGYGKSNLMKSVASSWKPGLGSLFIFDPEGEYAITDNQGRPGILDKIPAVLVTNRRNVATRVGANIYPTLKFNLADFSPKFIIPLLVPESKHEMIFFQKLMGLWDGQWRDLVDLFSKKGWDSSPSEISAIMKKIEDMEPDQSTGPIMNNLVQPIKSLHDRDSRLLDVLNEAAKKGLPVIMDISLLDSRSALQFCSIVVSHFFNKNQRGFIGRDDGREDAPGGDISKIVFVVEEAQSVIGVSSGIQKFIELAKEGRKYQLGAIFITQQPGAISHEILSQGDNFFVFHMLNKRDIKALNDANAHYSADVLTQILNEPVKGKSYMWSSPQPFVIPVQITNFEDQVQPGQAKSVQGASNVLGELLGGISKGDETENAILAKLKAVLSERGIPPGDIEQMSAVEKDLTRDLFKRLSPDELKYAGDQDGIQIGPKDGRPFAIKFTYFNKIKQKISLA